MNIITKTISNLLAISLIMVLMYGCQNKSEETITVKNSVELDTVAVNAVKVEYRDIKSSKTYTGSLEGEEQAYVVAKISERIVGIKVRVGDTVEKGKLVVELDKVGAASQYYQALMVRLLDLQRTGLITGWIATVAPRYVMLWTFVLES